MIEVGKNLTWHSNFINIIITGSETKPSMSSDEFAFLENILLSQIFGMNFVCLFVVTCHVLLLLSSTMLRAGLVDSMSCTVAVFDNVSCRYCRQYVMYCCCLRPCFVRVLSCIIGAVFDHASCGSSRQYVIYCCCCLVIMLCAGLVDCMSCIVVPVWRPCFVWVLSTLPKMANK